VFGDNLRRITGLHIAIPNGLGIDDHHRPVFALIETAGFIDAHPRAQSRCFYKLLQRGVKIALSVVSAGWTRSALGPNIMADKDMALVWRQNDFLRTHLSEFPRLEFRVGERRFPFHF